MFVRGRSLVCSRLVAVLGLGLAAAGVATAQNPAPPGQDTQKVLVTAYYHGLNSRADFPFKWKDATRDIKNTRAVGTLGWTVPMDTFGTAGMGRDYRTFCAETLVGVSAGKTYRFEITSPDEPAAYGLKNDEAGRAEALFKAAFIRELFGRYYLDAIDPNKPDEARAFQIALWEIINEGTLPNEKTVPVAASPFSLATGTFQADYAALDQSPVYVRRAQEQLASLTGDVNQFFGNPGLAGYQLVRMTGRGSLTDANEAVQAQFALQRVEGGVGGGYGAAGGGLGGGGAGGGFGGAPIGGFGGAPVGGFGGGFGGGLGGGGGGFIANPNNGPPVTTVPPTGGPPETTPPGPTPPIVIPPVGQPPTVNPPGEQPPDGTENTPVPAPAGVLLGLVGLGALGSYGAARRWLGRPAKTN